MPDRMSKLAIELGAVQHNLLRMHRFNCAQGDSEVAGILDVDHQLGPPARRNLANGAELLTTVGNKSLESNFNFFLHVLLLRRLSAAYFPWNFGARFC